MYSLLPSVTIALLLASASICSHVRPIGHDNAPEWLIAKRDKSPNPAVKSYSGCKYTGKPSCSSKTNDDIQMGECWANARVMGQRSAFFTAYQPGHKSYNSEGGPYGACTAYSCYPSESDMAKSDNLADLCFFWDGEDHTQDAGGGASSGSDSSSPGNESGKSGKGGNETNKSSSDADDKNTSKSKRDFEDKYPKDKSSDKSSSGSSPSDKSSDSGSSGKSSNSGSSDSSASSKNAGSTKGSAGSIPNAPGEDVIPIPMVCPSNLAGCYSASYFEKGGKLEAYANLKPTYKGLWFPPKDKSTHKPLFCQGMDLGCATPTMAELQGDKIKSQNCDVSKCKQPSGGSASSGSDGSASKGSGGSKSASNGSDGSAANASSGTGKSTSSNSNDYDASNGKKSKTPKRSGKTSKKSHKKSDSKKSHKKSDSKKSHKKLQYLP